MEPGLDETVSVFYRTERAGACRLSDGGDPFGFDITVALIAGDLITRYGCDAVAETGCFLGDTTAYLARRYPHLPVYACGSERAQGSREQHQQHRGTSMGHGARA